jgi:hypothetical protein
VSAERLGAFPLTDRELEDWMGRVPWHEAVSRPENPHAYTLRREQDRLEFQRVVLTIRERGYRRWFGGRQYTEKTIGEFYVWTMGAPIECTILVNRKRSGGGA